MKVGRVHHIIEMNLLFVPFGIYLRNFFEREGIGSKCLALAGHQLIIGGVHD